MMCQSRFMNTPNDARETGKTGRLGSLTRRAHQEQMPILHHDPARLAVQFASQRVQRKYGKFSRPIGRIPA